MVFAVSGYVSGSGFMLSAARGWPKRSICSFSVSGRVLPFLSAVNPPSFVRSLSHFDMAENLRVLKLAR